MNVNYQLTTLLICAILSILLDKFILLTTLIIYWMSRTGFSLTVQIAFVALFVVGNMCYLVYTNKFMYDVFFKYKLYGGKLPQKVMQEKIGNRQIMKVRYGDGIAIIVQDIDSKLKQAHNCHSNKKLINLRAKQPSFKNLTHNSEELYHKIDAVFSHKPKKILKNWMNKNFIKKTNRDKIINNLTDNLNKIETFIDEKTREINIDYFVRHVLASSITKNVFGYELKIGSEQCESLCCIWDDLFKYSGFNLFADCFPNLFNNELILMLISSDYIKLKNAAVKRDMYCFKKIEYILINLHRIDKLKENKMTDNDKMTKNDEMINDCMVAKYIRYLSTGNNGLPEVIKSKNEPYNPNHNFVWYLIKLKLFGKKEDVKYMRYKYFIMDVMMMIGDLLAASYETTLSSTKWAFRYVNKFQNEQVKIHNKLNECIGESNKHKIKELHNFLIEVMRKCPVAPFGIPHEKKIKGGKNTTYIYYNYGIQHNSNIFTNPDKFSPDRWNETNKIKLSNMYKNMRQFGNGERACPGRILGEDIYFTIFSFIIRKYKLQSVKTIPDMFHGSSIAISFVPHESMVVALI